MRLLAFIALMAFVKANEQDQRRSSSGSRGRNSYIVVKPTTDPGERLQRPTSVCMSCLARVYCNNIYRYLCRYVDMAITNTTYLL